jgi:hypothetical protein
LLPENTPKNNVLNWSRVEMKLCVPVWRISVNQRNVSQPSFSLKLFDHCIYNMSGWQAQNAQLMVFFWQKNFK